MIKVFIDSFRSYLRSNIPWHHLRRDILTSIGLLILMFIFFMFRLYEFLWNTMMQFNSEPNIVEWIVLKCPFLIAILALVMQLSRYFFIKFIRSTANIYINYILYKTSKNINIESSKYTIAKLGILRIRVENIILFIKKYLLTFKSYRTVLYPLITIIVLRIIHFGISDEFIESIYKALINFSYKDIYTIAALSILLLGIVVPATRIRGRMDSYRDNYKNSYEEIRKSSTNIISISKTLNEYINVSIEYFRKYFILLPFDFSRLETNELDEKHESFIESIEGLIKRWDDNIMELGLGPYFIDILEKEGVDISLISWIKSLQKTIPTVEHNNKNNILYIKEIGNLDIGAYWMKESTDRIEELRYIYTHRIQNLFYFNYRIWDIYSISYRRDSMKYIFSNILNK